MLKKKGKRGNGEKKERLEYQLVFLFLPLFEQSSSSSCNSQNHGISWEGNFFLGSSAKCEFNNFIFAYVLFSEH